MMHHRAGIFSPTLRLTGFCLLLLAGSELFAGDGYFEVAYPPSEKPGELVYGVRHIVWIPPGVKQIRGVIVHQHGCGKGACEGGATAAYDLHWQALAKKWDCALLGPSYQQEDGQNCRLWCDPRNGSGDRFVQALHDLAVKSGHPELEAAPWCLWGHSGGGFWASLMQVKHPERIVAIWFRSGTAFSAWEKGEVPKPEIPAAAYAIPMVANPGAKENGDKRFSGAWTGAMAMFKAYRAEGGLIAFTPDPRTAHECGDSRYLAIPFFDACLALRLPPLGAKTQTLLPMDDKQAWLAPLEGTEAAPAEKFTGDAKQANWLPNAAVAKAWSEYIRTGAVSDATPPPAPTGLLSRGDQTGAVHLVFSAEADFESGLASFILMHKGKPLLQLPESPKGRFGRPLFQAMSYHDTPEKPLPELKFTLSPEAGFKPEDFNPADYQVVAVNSVGLKSEPSAPAKRSTSK